MGGHKSINVDSDNHRVAKWTILRVLSRIGVIAQLVQSVDRARAIYCLRFSMGVFSINFVTVIWSLKQTAPVVDSNQYQAFSIIFYSTLFVAPGSLIVFFVLESLRFRFSGYACHMVRWMYKKFMCFVNEVIGTSPSTRPVVTTIVVSAAETKIPAQTTDLGKDVESPTASNVHDLDLRNKATATV